MQIHIFKDGDRFVANIPTSDGDRVAELPLDALDSATRERPATFLLSDPSPTVGFVKPFGERPLFEQERLAVQHRENADTIMRADAREQGEEFLAPPNSAPENKTQQSSIRGFASTAQHGMTARESRGLDHMKEQQEKQEEARRAQEEAQSEEAEPDIQVTQGTEGAGTARQVARERASGTARTASQSANQFQIDPNRPAASLPDPGTQPDMGARTAVGVSQGSGRSQMTQSTGRGASDQSGGAYGSLEQGELEQAQRTLEQGRQQGQRNTQQGAGAQPSAERQRQDRSREQGAEPAAQRYRGPDQAQSAEPSAQRQRGQKTQEDTQRELDEAQRRFEESQR